MQTYSLSPLSMMRSLWHNRELIYNLTKREVAGRYRGSLMGLTWSFFHPLLMLVVYTLVFSVVFRARWGLGESESRVDFAILLFVGMIVHGLFAECVNRSPSLVLGNANYVKKVIFPLEILPWVAFGAALFHGAISLVVLVLAQLLLKQHMPLTIVLFPIVILPLALGTMGLTWLLASLGVFLRDVGQLTSVFTTIMLFISAVFFPISSLPERYQGWMLWNPLAAVIEQSRQVVVFGVLPDPVVWLALFSVGCLMMWLGYAWFQKTRKGFADVL